MPPGNYGLTVTALAEYLSIARDRESNALAIESAMLGPPDKAN